MNAKLKLIPFLLVPLATGALWGFVGLTHSVFWFLLASVPTLLLGATGVAPFLWPGEPRTTQWMAIGSLLTLILCWPVFFIDQYAIFLPIGGIASFIVAGYLAFLHRERPSNMIKSHISIVLALKVAFDELLLGFFVFVAKKPQAHQAEKISVDIQKLNKILKDQDNYQAFHATPTLPNDIRLVNKNFGGLRGQLVSFNSGYVPDPRFPLANEWGNFVNNQRAYARVFQHQDGEKRPWLVCVHGFRMGNDNFDIMSFGIRYLHQKLGLNILMPLLPLHGLRREGMLGGEYYIDGHVLNFIHAESQAIYDIRTLLAWIRKDEPDAKIGVYGLSLGGYTSALLSCFEPKLDCVIAGIPAADFAELLELHMPQDTRRELFHYDISDQNVAESYAVVSPLAMPSLVPVEKKYMFCGTSDRVVPPGNSMKIWQHWGQCTLEWYHGGHLTFRHSSKVRRFINRALREQGFIGQSIL